MPYSIIDSRLIDLAISFWDNPDDRILKGYRRLEDRFRDRSGSEEFSSKLFAEVLNKRSNEFGWKDLNPSEHGGRSNLFTGAYMAFRNRRAHRENELSPNDDLREFLLLNQLFCLERELIEKSE